MNVTGGQIVGVAVAAVVLYAAWRTVRFGESAAEAVAVAVNPADSRNIVNRAVSAIGSAITGEPDFSLGSHIFDLVNPGQ